MTKKSVAIIVAILGAGVLFAQINTNTTNVTGGSSAGVEWAMLAASTAGPTSDGAGYEIQPTVFTYNQHTGIVYRYFAVCGDWQFGCFIAIGYRSHEDENVYTTPTPFSGGSGQLPR